MDNYRIEGYLVGYSIALNMITLKILTITIGGNPYSAEMEITHDLKSSPTMEELRELDRRIETGQSIVLNFNVEGGA